MRKLHIGGKIVKEGWEIFNIRPAPGVDYIGDAANLGRFKDETFDEIYASHILEHFNPAIGNNVLKEWNRVLKSGGTLYVSVPDMDILCDMFIDKKLKNEDRLYLLSIMYGSQLNKNGYHHYGYNWEILSTNLFMAGFTVGNRVETFGIFDDLSNAAYTVVNSNGELDIGRKISLNIVAKKRLAKQSGA